MNMNLTGFRFRTTLLASAFLMLLAGCASLNKMVSDAVKKPDVNVSNVKISGMSFDAVDLVFNIDIANPNGMGISLAGFDYGLNINGNSFLSGNNTDGLKIPANGSHAIQLPLTLKFKDIYQTFTSIRGQDTSGYELKAGFSFDLPVLGAVRVPVSKSGNVPLLKLPSVQMGGLKLNRINLTSADLELGIKIDNPNAFGMILNKLNYNFAVNGQTWGTGVTSAAMSVGQKGESEVKIPLSLNFLQIGTSVYQLLKGNNALDYKLTGDVNLGSTLPLLQDLQLNFDRNGNVNLQR